MLKPKKDNIQLAKGMVRFASMNAAIINKITARHRNIKDSLSLF